MSSPTLFDRRSGTFREHFSQGLEYQSYLATGTEKQQTKWRDHEARVQISAPQRSLLKSFKREMNVLVLSGIWCGDCARQCPMLNLIANESPAINLRFVDNEACPELRDEVRICGGTRVPTVLVLSEDFFEVGRFGDRTLSVYRRKAINELGAACDAGILPAPGHELAAEMQEWVDQFERMQLMLRLSPFLRMRHKD